MRTIATLLASTFLAFVLADQAGHQAGQEVNEWLDTNLWSQTAQQ